MFRALRTGHKWGGLIAALFLFVIGVTGFFLATKARWSWIRPAEQKGQELTSSAEIAPMGKVMDAAFAVGLAELKEPKDIDRVDYRPKSNVFKVTSKEGYHEVQVDGRTGEVLQVAKRWDQFTEDIHDLSFFNDALHQVALPLVAIILTGLSISGVFMYVIPILRRRKFEREKATKPPV